MMGGESVTAAVVTFNPDAGLEERLRRLVDQAAAVVVVDNGSREAAGIAALTERLGIALIANRANLGIARALNQAADWAFGRGAAWLALFDHDSLVPEAALPELLRLVDGLDGRLGVLAMSHRDRATGADYHRPADVLVSGPGWRGVRTTITSGSLIRRQAYAEAGPFDDALFIDAVDHDFCLRCRRAGWAIVEAERPVLEHALGDISRVLGAPLSNHSPDRRYYITRNTLEVARRHRAFDPTWSRQARRFLLADSLAVLLFESRRGDKLRAIFDGVRDFRRRRFGPRLSGRPGSGE
ncbi:MAG TPA: glycosyltransferase family 2 protein [Caulobacteraceae bacterium]|jgi:rhamnosyltransferase